MPFPQEPAPGEMQCERGRWKTKIAIVAATDSNGQTKEGRLQQCQSGGQCVGPEPSDLIIAAPASIAL